MASLEFADIIFKKCRVVIPFAERIAAEKKMAENENRIVEIGISDITEELSEFRLRPPQNSSTAIYDEDRQFRGFIPNDEEPNAANLTKIALTFPDHQHAVFTLSKNDRRHRYREKSSTSSNVRSSTVVSMSTVRDVVEAFEFQMMEASQDLTVTSVFDKDDQFYGFIPVEEQEEQQEAAQYEIEINNAEDDVPDIDEPDDVKPIVIDLVDDDDDNEEDASNDVNDSVDCPFCSKRFPTRNALKDHPIFCPGMKSFEPMATCCHCRKTLPMSLSGLHEITCDQYKWRLNLVDNNLNSYQIRCDTCADMFVARQFPRHLSRCLKMLQVMLGNALENSELVWNRHNAQTTDYFGEAGIKDWINKVSDN